jgi:hypothetical protein
LNLLSIDEQNPFPQAANWHRVRQRISKREMPPAGEPQPTDEERRKLLAYAQATIDGYTLDGQPDPGPLTARRLNVREHRNIFRDLAIDGERAQPRRASYETKKDGSVNLYDAVIPPPEHPCDFVTRALPPDTQDGGFDTVGENLSIPPFLLERYLRASKILLDDCFSLKGKDEHGRYQWRLRELVEKAADGPLPRGVNSRREAVVGLLQEFASRAFRRPVGKDEVEKYARLFDAGQQRGDDRGSSFCGPKKPRPFQAKVSLKQQPAPVIGRCLPRPACARSMTTNWPAALPSSFGVAYQIESCGCGSSPTRDACRMMKCLKSRFAACSTTGE